MSRIQAREFAFKMIFSLDFNNESNVDFIKNSDGVLRLEENNLRLLLYENGITETSDINFSVNLINSYIDNQSKINELIKKYTSSYKFTRIFKCDLSIIRLAIAEMLLSDYDYKIIINEAVELSKKYSEEKSYKFVHGVLANIVKELYNEWWISI